MIYPKGMRPRTELAAYRVTAGRLSPTTRFAAAFRHTLLQALRASRVRIWRVSKTTLVEGGHIFRSLSAVRAPLLVSIFGALVLSLLPQIQEIYHVISLNYATDPWPAWKSVASLFVASSSLWFFADQLARRSLNFRDPKSRTERFC